MVNPNLVEQFFYVDKIYSQELWAQELDVTKNCKRIKDFYSECVPGVKIYANDTFVGTTDEMGLIDVYDFFCEKNFGKEFELTFVKDGYSRCISPTTVARFNEPYKGFIDLSVPANNTFKCPDYLKGNISFRYANSRESRAAKEKLKNVGIYPRIVTIWQDDDVNLKGAGYSTANYSVFIMVGLCDYPLLKE